MYKEMIISIILVCLIFVGDFVSQKYTKNTVNSLTGILEDLKASLLEKDKEEASKEIEALDKIWEDVHDKLACYIEHDELEKVETNFTACKSLSENGDFVLAVSELEKTVFVLEHIIDKYSFNLVNIF